MKHKIYVMVAMVTSWAPKSLVLWVDEKLSGKRLLWAADDALMDEMGYDTPIRFDKFKETSFGVMGVGPTANNLLYSLMVVSYNPIDHLRSDFINSLALRKGLDPHDGFLEAWYEETN